MLGKVSQNSKPQRQNINNQFNFDTNNNEHFFGLQRNLESKTWDPNEMRCDGLLDKKTIEDHAEVLGMPYRTKKSFGYRNLSEHQFYYIDPSIQHEDSAMMPFPRGGISTRMDNKKNTYCREIF